MEHYGSITTPVSVPRLIVGAMLAAGVAVLIMAFTKYGLLAGLAVSVIPAALCILWVTLRNPAISMLGLFVVNYFIMTLTRYAYDLPFGMILDALIFYNFLIITLQALMRPIEWKRASSGLTVVAAIWMAYCILEIVNPESVSVAGWFSSVRSIAFYFFFIVVLTQLTMTEYKYLKYMLAVWSVLTLIAVGKACMQKFFGFNAAENYWLFVLGGRSTHIIHSGVRYFSFFSDAANFGGSMGLSMVVFSISALYYRNSWMKLYLLLVAAAACYGMLISGTRSALAVPFVGYSAFIMMSRNIKMIGAGVFLIIAAFIFLKFTTIGQGNSIIRRARSAFNTNDPSFQVRLANQAKLRELMADKPFGAGLGHGGGKAKTFAPNAALSQIPTDSWFVMVWVETGVVGILLHIGILLAVLIATMMIPAMALLIPVYKLLGSMGLVNSYLGIIIPRMADVGGIFLLRQFFISIPKDLDNAARIDGAGEFRIFAQIILPNAVPAILTVGMFNFMGNWNDLLWPLIMTSKPETRTITAGLAMLTGHGSSVTPYGVVMAGALISALPLLIVFFFVQKRFVEGIAMTGMK